MRRNSPHLSTAHPRTTLVMKGGYKATRTPATWMPHCLDYLPLQMSLIPCSFLKLAISRLLLLATSCGRTLSILLESRFSIIARANLKVQAHIVCCVVEGV